MTWDSQLRGLNLSFLMLIDVRWAHFAALPGERCLWSFLLKPARIRAMLDVCSRVCMVVETLE